VIKKVADVPVAGTITRVGLGLPICRWADLLLDGDDNAAGGRGPVEPDRPARRIAPGDENAG